MENSERQLRAEKLLGLGICFSHYRLLEHMIRLQWYNTTIRADSGSSTVLRISSNISLVRMVRANGANSNLIGKLVFECRSDMTQDQRTGFGKDTLGHLGVNEDNPMSLYPREG